MSKTKDHQPVVVQTAATKKPSTRAAKAFEKNAYIHIQEIVDKGLLPMGYHHLYNGIRRGLIPHFKFGNRYYMTLEQIEQFKRSSEHKIQYEPQK